MLQTEKITVRIDPPLLAMIKDESRRLQRSKSDTVRVLVRQALSALREQTITKDPEPAKQIRAN